MTRSNKSAHSSVSQRRAWYAAAIAWLGFAGANRTLATGLWTQKVLMDSRFPLLPARPAGERIVAAFSPVPSRGGRLSALSPRQIDTTSFPESRARFCSDAALSCRGYHDAILGNGHAQRST